MKNSYCWKLTTFLALILTILAGCTPRNEYSDIHFTNKSDQPVETYIGGKLLCAIPPKQTKSFKVHLGETRTRIDVKWGEYEGWFGIYPKLNCPMIEHFNYPIVFQGDSSGSTTPGFEMLPEVTIFNRGSATANFGSYAEARTFLKVNEVEIHPGDKVIELGYYVLFQLKKDDGIIYAHNMITGEKSSHGKGGPIKITISNSLFGMHRK